MTVWFAIPSARPVSEAARCFDSWKAIGCKVAATRKNIADREPLGLDLIISLPEYPGYYAAINILTKAILEADPECVIVATGGDDVFPDPDRHAEDIADEFVAHFGGTLGVMQPTGGNPWSRGMDESGRRIVERVAWGPWMGREWCRRAYLGKGPMWPEYWHFFGDQELQIVALNLSLFLQRKDIKQEHHNWKVVGDRIRPAFLYEANARWGADQGLYKSREAAGFPGAELMLS